MIFYSYCMAMSFLLLFLKHPNLKLIRMKNVKLALLTIIVATFILLPVPKMKSQTLQTPTP